MCAGQGWVGSGDQRCDLTLSIAQLSSNQYLLDCKGLPRCTPPRSTCAGGIQPAVVGRIQVDDGTPNWGQIALKDTLNLYRQQPEIYPVSISHTLSSLPQKLREKRGSISPPHLSGEAAPYLEIILSFLYNGNPGTKPQTGFIHLYLGQVCDPWFSTILCCKNSNRSLSFEASALFFVCLFVLQDKVIYPCLFN